MGAAPKTSRDLSAELSVSEKEVTFGLRKLELSLRHQGLELGTGAARCLACGFEFERRGRLTKPSRCPGCKSERIQPPRFWIAQAPGST